MTSLDSLVSAFVASKPLERAAVAGELAAALCHCSTTPPACGKENSRAVPAGNAKAVRAAAATALKVVQTALSTSSRPIDVADLIALGRASLSVLDAHSTDAAAAQLPALRYNLLRRLVTLKAYGPGLEEAVLLRVQLSAVYGRQHGGGRVLPPSDGSPLVQEAANLAVGAALILLLCCAESGQPSCEALGAALQAARDLPAWLSLIKPEEAARHGDAAYCSMYKMAVAFIEARSWASARDTAGAMVAAAATDASQARRAVQAAGKFLGHLPETEAATLLAELASGFHCLPAAAANDLLGPLCSAAQRAEQPALLHEAFSSVSSSSSPILRQAALLLPVLGMECERALQLAADAAAEAEGSLAALERHLDAQQLPLTELHRHLAVVGAAFQVGNTLRRLLSVERKGAAAPSSAAAQLAAAAALDLLAGTVGVGALVLASAAAPEAASLPFAGQGHAAAVALVSAARLRAAADAAPPTGCLHLQRLLGWDCLGEAAPASGRGTCPVELSELAWMASALFNVGVDLHAAGRFAAAVPPLRDALVAAGVCLAQCAESGEDGTLRLQDFIKRSAALADAQQRAGDGAAALATLASSLVALASLDFESPDDWRPLVTAYVRLKAQLLSQQGGAQPAAAPPCAAAGTKARGRSRAVAGRSRVAGDAAEVAGGTAGLAAAMLQHGLARSAVTVAEQELQAWNAQASHPELGDVSAAEALRLVDSFLQQLWPADRDPTAHARLLLLLFKLRLSAGGCAERELLVRAAQVLGSQAAAAAQGRAAVLGQVQAALAVDGAQQLVQEAVEQQKQHQRRESHAAASTSTGSTKDVAPSDAPPLPTVMTKAWQQVREQAEAALQQLEKGDAAGEQLQRMLGLQGHSSDALLGCLLPGAADDTKDAAALQAEAQWHVATAAPALRSTEATLQRVSLHQQAAEQLAAGGRMVEALHEASEAHRLAGALFHGGAASVICSASGCWWQLAANYAACLMQLGILFELAGLPDEALHALKEGHRLAVAVGSHLLAASCASKLASVYCKQRQLEHMEQAVEAAVLELEAAGSAASLPAQLCHAELAAAMAETALVAGETKAAWRRSQAAMQKAEQLAATAGATVSGHAASLHARALLAASACAAAEGDVSRARTHAVAALEATKSSVACSTTPYWQAAALVGLAEVAEDAMVLPTPQLAIWGLSPAAASPAPAAKSARGGRGTGSASGRRLGAAPRGRSAEAPAQPDGDGTGPGAGGHRARWLWQALALSQELPSLNRRAASLLAEVAGQAGRLHLAALLLHLSLGGAMRLQYRLVLHTKARQLAMRAARGAEVPSSAEQGQELHELLEILDAGLDWQAVQQLGSEASDAPAATARGKKAAAGRAARATNAVAGAQPPNSELLAALDAQAEQALRSWMDALPVGTVVAALGTGRGGASIVACRLEPGGASAPLLMSLPAHPLSASLSKHPIRALSMDEEPAGDKAACSVQSVLDEMDAILQGSTASMRELATDTREQQREWWRARLELDDRLAALLAHLGSSWLGPWRCLLGGMPGSQSAAAANFTAKAVVRRLLELAAPVASRPSPLQESLLAAAATALLCGAASGTISAADLEQALQQLATAVGSQGLGAADAKALAAQLVNGGAQAAAAKVAGGTVGQVQQQQQEQQPLQTRKAVAKSVKFADDAAAQEELLQASMAAAGAAAAEPAKRGNTRGRRAAAGTSTSSRGGRSAAADETIAGLPGSTAGTEVDGDDCSSPTTVGTAAATAVEPPQTVVRGTDLCGVFDALSLGDGGEPPTAAPATQQLPTTSRPTSKHRSRLRLMGAATPARPGTSRKPEGGAAGGGERGVATAPRAPRPLPMSVAKTAPPPAARSATAAADEASEGTIGSAAPVLVVLDGALQALPWESVPRLRDGRLYRCPSLASAAASSARRRGSGGGGSDGSAAPDVDLGSTFYALNPGGDLAATQSAFQDWFAQLAGWEGKAGEAPSASELAAALSSRSAFVYLGHGGGEQYLPPSRLRALDRCASSLLMGCSSGRLRGAAAVAGHYDPSGPVLAYLLAGEHREGCPTAIANLWDVTDRDIDRFSQALLTRWLSAAGSSREASAASDGTSSGAGSIVDASSAVAAARGVCKLPHLIGAAPICYGIPTTVRPPPTPAVKSKR